MGNWYSKNSLHLIKKQADITLVAFCDYNKELRERNGFSRKEVLICIKDEIALIKANINNDDITDLDKEILKKHVKWLNSISDEIFNFNNVNKIAFADKLKYEIDILKEFCHNLEKRLHPKYANTPKYSNFLKKYF